MGVRSIIQGPWWTGICARSYDVGAIKLMQDHALTSLSDLFLPHSGASDLQLLMHHKTATDTIQNQTNATSWNKASGSMNFTSYLDLVQTSLTSTVIKNVNSAE